MNSVYKEMKEFHKDDPFMKKVFELVESDMTFREKTDAIWNLFEERRKKKKETVDESQIHSQSNSVAEIAARAIDTKE